MDNNRNPNQKQPGEKEPGKYHYNPGNQSGKGAEIGKAASEEKNKVDGRQTGRGQQDQKR